MFSTGCREADGVARALDGSAVIPLPQQPKPEQVRPSGYWLAGGGRGGEESEQGERQPSGAGGEDRDVSKGRDCTEGSFDGTRYSFSKKLATLGLFCSRRWRWSVQGDLAAEELLRLGVSRVHAFIGQGAFSQAFECSLKGHGPRVAVKRSMHPETDGSREILILQELKHPHIIRVVKVISARPLCVAYDLYKGGTLKCLLHNPDTAEVVPKLKMRQRIDAAIQIASGVGFLHKNMVIHRDIKPENVFLEQQVVVGPSSVVMPNLVLGDFGFARFLPSEGETDSMTRCGSLCYIAPEVLADQVYSCSADVFSLGNFLYEVVTGCVPYSERDLPQRALVLEIVGGLRPNRERLPRGRLGEDLGAILTKAWDGDPEQRATVKEMLGDLQLLEP